MLGDPFVRQFEVTLDADQGGVPISAGARARDQHHPRGSQVISIEQLTESGVKLNRPGFHRDSVCASSVPPETPGTSEHPHPDQTQVQAPAP